MNRAQPAEYEAHDQCAAARGESKRKTSDYNGQQSHQASEENSEADEDHVCHHRPAVSVAEVFGGPLNVALGTDQSQQVASLHFGFRGEWH